MVNTLALYDIPHRSSRLRLESLLRAAGFMWLFPYARWSSSPLAQHERLLRRVRSRFKGEMYRMVFIEITADRRTGALWLTATRTRRP